MNFNCILWFFSLKLCFLENVNYNLLAGKFLPFFWSFISKLYSFKVFHKLMIYFEWFLFIREIHTQMLVCEKMMSIKSYTLIFPKPNWPDAPLPPYITNIYLFSPNLTPFTIYPQSWSQNANTLKNYPQNCQNIRERCLQCSFLERIARRVLKEAWIHKKKSFNI